MRIGRRTLEPRHVGIAAAVVLTVALAVVVAGPSGSLQEDGPGGTLALRRFLAALGHGGREATALPEAGTLVLREDVRTPDEVDDLLAWVRDGHRLVVPVGTPTAAELGVETDGLVGGSFRGVATLAAGCGPLAGVREVAVRVTDHRLDAPSGATGCLGAPPFLVELAEGDGTVVVLGGLSPLTNELLDAADNAAFAVRVLLGAQTGPVTFGPPRPPGAEGRGLWAALPPAARATLVGLVVALVVFALVRGRRLGLPPAEPDPSPLPQRAIVDATGQLLHASGDRAYVAQVLRDATASRLRRRLALPAHTDLATVADLAADAAGRDRAQVRALLAERPVHGEPSLLALARELEGLARALEPAPEPDSDSRPSVRDREAVP